MSGGIKIGSDASWLKAGWLSEYIATELRAGCSDGVAAKLEEVGKWPGAIADFSDASSGEMGELYRSVMELLRRMEAVGPTALHDPAFFPSSLRAVNELLSLLRADHRTLAAQQRAAGDVRNART